MSALDFHDRDNDGAIIDEATVGLTELAGYTLIGLGTASAAVGGAGMFAGGAATSTGVGASVGLPTGSAATALFLGGSGVGVLGALMASQTGLNMADELGDNVSDLFGTRGPKPSPKADCDPVYEEGSTVVTPGQALHDQLSGVVEGVGDFLFPPPKMAPGTPPPKLPIPMPFPVD